MATGDTVIEASLRLLGILREGGSASTDQKANGLEAINMILGSWDNDGLIRPYRTTESFSVGSSISGRTIGASGDWNTGKPTKIEFMWVRDSNNIDHYVKEITAKQYAKLQGKGVATGRPEQFYFEPIDATTPATHAKVFFDKTTSATETFYIMSYKVFSQLSASTNTIALPQAWIRALKFQLAVDRAQEYGKAVSGELAGLAKQSIDQIRLLMSASVEVESSDEG